MRKFIIDTDTASDDALAIIAALREPTIEVVGITTVTGNVPVDIATRNAKISVEMAGTYQPPIYKGCSRAVIAPYRTAQAIHGMDGLGDLGLDEPNLPTKHIHAVNAIIEMVEKNEDIEIITLGPLTNIALAMAMAPATMKKVKHIYSMGGAHMRCNAHTITSEFNIMVDPESAGKVMQFGVPITMAPFEICLGDSGFTPEEVEEIYAFNTKCAKFCMDCNITLLDFTKKVFGISSLLMPDPTAVVCAIFEETILKSTECYGAVDTKGRYTYGQTTFDYNNTLGKEPNVRVIDEIDTTFFKKVMYDKITMKVEEC